MDDSDAFVSRIRQRIKAACLKSCGNRSLYELCLNADADGSGTLDYGEFKHFIRKDLKVSKKVVLDVDIKRLYEYIDDAGTNEITVEELAGFIQRGDKNLATNNEEKRLNRLKKVRKIVKTSFLRYAQAEALKTGNRSVDWYALFSRYDLDGGGELSFHELSLALRQDLKLNSWDVDTKDLRELYDFIDSDGSGGVAIDEMIEFVDAQDEDEQTRKGSTFSLGHKKTIRQLLALKNGDVTKPALSATFNAVPREVLPTSRLAASGTLMLKSTPSLLAFAKLRSKPDELLKCGSQDGGTEKKLSQKTGFESPDLDALEMEEALMDVEKETTAWMRSKGKVTLDRVQSIIGRLKSLGVNIEKDRRGPK